MNVCGKELKSKGQFVRMGRLAHEGFEFVEDVESTIEELKRSRALDLFTFLQKLPHSEPLHRYPMEMDNVAALPVSTFEQWWTKQIDAKTRNMVRRGEKKGVELREVSFDDNLARGIWEIYNETPVRQGRKFPHYGKDFETVRTMSASFLPESVFIGAFLEGKLIGFLKLTWDEARSQAAVMHIIAMIQHRDKAPTNALLAKGVEACAARKLPYIVYSKFDYGKKGLDGLREFKVSNGFQRVDLPRYYVPLSPLGEVALRYGFHRSLRDRLPDALVAKLLDLRYSWYKRVQASASTPVAKPGDQSGVRV
jgi:hypothetical protein